MTNESGQMTREAMRRQRAGVKRYISGFDGIRTLAVLGVIIYHLAPAAMQGGYLGVPIFFVVSGYLITYLLIQEWDAHLGVDIRGFYVRRLKRLYPALVAMLVGTTAYITLFQRSLLTNIRATVTTNLLYVYNWFEVNHGQSYFDRFNGESPFTHLWSLSIEGQFYLVWPLVVIGLLMLFKKRAQITGLLLGLAVISALLMAILYDPTNTNRVYYGTDTRMFAILIGAALAFVWPAYRLSPNLNMQQRWVLNGVGLGSLALLMWLFFTMDGQAASTYHGGMFVFTLLAGLLVATVAHPGSDMNRILTNPVFSYVGQRSYGIYLYQFPVMIFYESQVQNIGDHPLMNALIEVGLILLISEISYRYIENPLRRYHYQHLASDLKAYWQMPAAHRLINAIGGLAVILFTLTAVGFTQQPSGAAQPTALQKKITKNQAEADKKNAAAARRQKRLEQQAKAEADKKADLKKLSPKQRKTAEYYFLTSKEYQLAKKTALTAVGDSVLLDDAGGLQTIFPGAVINGQVGRQAAAVPGVIASLKQQGQLANTVLINIGTNGNIEQVQAEQIIAEIGPDRQIFWVNAHVPTREWQNQVNGMITLMAKKHKNVHVIDWHTEAKNHPTWFVSDHVHPNNTGNRYFTSLIAKSIAAQDH